MRILLLGPPGSGKVPVSERIAEKYGLPVITITGVLRAAAAEPTELGRLAKEAVELNRVSDELQLALLRLRLAQPDLQEGFVLVDFPRNAGQADVLDSMLDDLGRPVDIALLLEADNDDLMERLVGRITCDNCGAEYNIYVNPPMVEGACDRCGARVSRRPDDYEETIGNRLRVYGTLVGPLAQYYALLGKLHRVGADGAGVKTWQRIEKIIDNTEPVEPVPPPEPARGRGRKGAARARAEQAAAKSTTDGAEATKRAAKKAEPKAAATNKAATKKAPAKKTTAKKTAAKKTPAKKATVRKVAAKKTAKKKTATKKSTAKKAATKKTAVKRAATRKTATKKAATKKTAAKKATAKKPAAKKAAAKKTAAKKTATRKPATARKATAKKVAAKKAATRKAAAKKPTPRKAATKKAASKKAVSKKSSKKRAAKKKAPARASARRR